MMYATTPFGAGLVVYGVVATATALIALDLLTDSIAVRHMFLKRGINGARKRYTRLRIEGDVLETVGQMLMLAAAAIAYIGPNHDGVWLLATLSLYELTRVVANLNKRRTRNRTMEDLARADEHQ